MDSPHKHRHLPASSPRTSLHCPVFLPSDWSSCLHTRLWLPFWGSWHQSVREDWSAPVFSPDFISWRFAMSWHAELTRRQYTHVRHGEKVSGKDESWIKINWQPRDSVKNNQVWEYCDRNTDNAMTLGWPGRGKQERDTSEENEAMLQFISLNIPAIMAADSWAPAPSAGHVPLIIRHNWQFSVWDFPRNIV